VRTVKGGTRSITISDWRYQHWHSQLATARVTLLWQQPAPVGV
jgi:hypothetical protein